jgi:hypothetical protein
MAEMNTSEQMSEILDEAANLVLGDIAADVVHAYAESAADLEAIEVLQQIGSDEPRKWITELSSTYLNQVAHELRSIAALLREDLLVGSLEVLVRATVERVGRINWVLDHDPSITARRRTIRASFEILVSYQHYRIGIEKIGAGKADQKRVVREMKDARALVEQWFSDIQRPALDPTDPDSVPTPTISDWTIEGEQYPNYSQLARWAIPDSSIPDNVASGTYAALSAFSHPSFVAHRELLVRIQSSAVYYYDFDYLHRLIGLSLFGYVDSLKRWSSYFDISHLKFVEKLDPLSNRWQEIELSAGDLDSG